MYGDIGLKRPLPLHFISGGLINLLIIVFDIYKSSDAVVFLDEIDTGLHHSVIGKVWEAIGKAAEEFNTQVFATTHSRECIVAAHEAFSKGKKYDFRLHRLEMIKDKIHAITYDKKTLSGSIELDWEVR